MPEFIEHPLIKEKALESRTYQEVIAASASGKNTMVVLPTGLGKTAVGILLSANRLDKYPDSKILMMAPTKPLVEQHRESFMKALNISKENFIEITGETKPEERVELYQKGKILFATPQTVQKDLEANRAGLKDFSLLIFDECHRAVKDYAYVPIASDYIKSAENSRILGLTASPGGDKEKIEEVASNLFIENYEIRTEEDSDVEEYVKEKRVNWIKISLTKHFKRVRRHLKDAYRTRLKKLKGFGFVNSTSNVSKKQLLNLQKKIGAQLSDEKSPRLFQGISLASACLKLQHGLELLETQGLEPLHKYFEEMKKDDSRASKSLLKDDDVNNALSVIKWMYNNNKEHPKLEKLKEILEDKIKDKKNAIVFTQYRKTVDLILEELSEMDNLKPVKFIGQKKGYSQDKQKEILEEFREGKYNALVSTSLHPEETIVVRSPKGEISVKEIGKFVECFLEEKNSSKVNSEWEAFTTNGKKSSFKPITRVHRHKRKNKVLNSYLQSCGSFLVTENHSVYSFNSSGDHKPAKPKEKTFVNLALEAPKIEKEIEIDLAKVLDRELPEEEKEKFYFTFNGLNHSRIRMMNSERKFLNSTNGKSWIKKISDESNLDSKTVSNIARRLEKRSIVTIKPMGRKKIISISKRGKRYKEFLNWFNSNQRYYKQKYRIDFESVLESPEYFRDFCDLKLERAYGKTSIPRFLKLNEELARFLGYFVSEGSIRNREKGGELQLTSHGGPIKEKMEKSVIQGLKMTPKKQPAGILIYSRLAYYLIKYVFKCGTSTEGKQIPPKIFSSPENIKNSFLEAYFEGDGYSNGKHIVLTTISRKLATGLNFLLRQLGVKKISIRKEKREKQHHRDIYRVEIKESLNFRTLEQKSGKSSYYDLVPNALGNKKAWKKFSNKYSQSIESPKCRKKSVPEQSSSFDFIKRNEIPKKQPDFVYDISVEGTERFFGGTGLACLHNSIGEEGLDVPGVDYVVFYEPIPSEIRTIQRRGRTGRQKAGDIYVLITENTRDEAYYWSSHHKEKKMKNVLEELKEGKKKEAQKSLDSFSRGDEIIIYADDREDKTIKKFKELDKDIKIRRERLEIADFLISERTAVEKKTSSDFVDSIIDNRLFEQLRELKEQFERPVLLIEGKSLFGHREVHPNAIRGALASIIIDFQVPILWTSDLEDTVETLITLAKREQKENDKRISIRGEKAPKSTKGLQKFLICGLPSVSGKLAERLLKKFGTPKKIFNASETELKEVEGIGEGKAEKIKNLLEKDYNES